MVYYRANDERDEVMLLLLQLLITLFVKKVRTSRISSVLYRTNAQSRTIEEALLKSNIPYTMVGGTKFYSRKEIRDVISYLNLIANPADNISFERVVNEPKRGVGPGTLEKIRTLPMSKT
ncbi:MAG: 3'-5' exonuclease [Streptococcus salivarius]